MKWKQRNNFGFMGGGGDLHYENINDDGTSVLLSTGEMNTTTIIRR
jgi:hypothetical protein